MTHIREDRNAADAPGQSVLLIYWTVSEGHMVSLGSHSVDKDVMS